MRRTPLAFLVVVSTAGCAERSADDPTMAPSLTLWAEQTTAPADGLSTIGLVASVDGAAYGAVVDLALDGVGLLSRTRVALQAGVAEAVVYAPFEGDLSGVEAAATVRASFTAGDQLLRAEQELVFTVPTEGAPVLTAYAAPDRVVAGSGESVRLVIEGRRLVDATVQLTVTPALAGLPPSVELSDAGDGLRAEVDVVAPAAPGVYDVTIAADGVAPVHVELHFIADDAPRFDLNGTFAQVGFGVVRVGGLIFLDPDPQCVVAPTIGLVRVTQDGTHVTMSGETCSIEMGDVNVHFVGASRSWVEQPFIDASNAHATGPLELELDSVELDAAVSASAEALAAPFILGAELASPDDALPTSDDDPRVRDHDDDGDPGVTIHNSSQGAQQVVLRTRTTSWNAVIHDSNHITGVVEIDSESNLLNGGGITPTMTDMPAPFTLARVDGQHGATDIAGRDGDPSSITCADVLAYQAELLSQVTAPDPLTACDP